jgi:hypothetical protein
MSGRERNGCTEPEESQVKMAAHARARYDTPQEGSHWTTTQSFEVSKAADACGTLEEAGESCTELFEGEALEGERGI